MQWQAMGSPINRHVYCFATYGDEFLIAQENICNPSQPLLRWTGADWEPFGPPMDAYIWSLVVHEGSLYAGGAMGPPVCGTDIWSYSVVARLEESGWCSIADSFLIPYGFPSPLDPYVQFLTTFQGDIAALGQIVELNNVPVSNVGLYDGGTWRPLHDGVSHLITGGATFNGDLIVVGVFSGIDGVASSGIARWDGKQWHGLQQGLRSSWDSIWVSSAVEFEGKLLVVGSFETAGNVVVNGKAQWDGENWQPLALPPLAMGIRRLQVHEGELYAIAGFTAGYIMKLVDGGWQQIGGASPQGIDELIFDADSNPIIASGYSVRRWNGAQWEPLGYFDGSVHSLAYFNGDLYAGGTLTGADNEVLHGIARWDGKAWHDVGGGMELVNGYQLTVGSLQTYNGSLFAAGWFTHAGGNPAAGLARWDGREWHGLGGTSGFGPWAFLEHDGELCMFGGLIEQEPGVYSAFISRWRECPQIPGDLTGDGVVNADDLLVLLGAWGACADWPSTPCIADLAPAGGDGLVNVDDLLALLSNWG